MDKEIYKAYENLEFLNSHEARSIRVLCELVEPAKRLDTQNISNTIVFFGSARSKPYEEAKEDLEALLQRYPKGTRSLEEEQSIIKAESILKLSKFYDEAVSLSSRLSSWSKECFEPENQFHICSGGGPGMMEAANKGARDTDSESIGLGISLPFEQGVNKYVSRELAFEFHYFFVRKFYFLYHAKAVVVFPGGFGTMDELFEVLTLIQTGKIGKNIPIFLYGKEFWDGLINFEQFVSWGVISPNDLSLFQIVDSVDEAFDKIVSQLSSEKK